MSDILAAFEVCLHRTDGARQNLTPELSAIPVKAIIFCFRPEIFLEVPKYSS
jgi:hypothetical protein